MNTTRLLPLIALAALLFALAPLAVLRHAAASSLLTVEIVPPASAAAGQTAAITVRATGEDAELAPLEYAIEGGTITGTLSLAEVAPGVAEATVFVRRDTAGEAVLSVRVPGTVVASGTVRFAEAAPLQVEQTAPVQVSVALANGPAASARTWRFEIVDAAGALADTVEVSMSGDQPLATAASRALPFGEYTVRQLLGNDTATTCDGAAFYATNGSNVPVTLAAGSAPALITVTVCDEAPDGLGVTIISDAPPADAPGTINEVRGVRVSGDGPLPPSTGTGQAEAPAAPDTDNASLLAALALLALSAPGAYLAVRFVPSRRD